MLKIDYEYSDYVGAADEEYPAGKAIDASAPDTVDGTPILASFFNDVIGFMQAVFFGVFGSEAKPSGKPDNAKNSDVWNAIKKFVGDSVQVVKDAVAEINGKIPPQASAENQLADKDFVNSSISTNTAYFVGTFDSLAALNAYSGTKTNNDYAFVKTTDSAGNTIYNRYKWNGSQWLFEYALNNSSFTSDQWAAVNSGATAAKINQIKGMAGATASAAGAAGFVPQPPAGAQGKFLRGDGTWSEPSNIVSFATELATARLIDGVAFKGSTNIAHFGQCTTIAATQVKSVSISGFALVAGARVSVLFANGNAAGSLSGNSITQASAPMLNVQSTGAKPIKVGNAYAGPNFVNAGEVHDFVYDGSAWNDVTASVIFKGSNGNGNYVKHRDGLIEQWNFNVSSNPSINIANRTTVYLPIPFSSNNYMVTCMPFDQNNNIDDADYSTFSTGAKSTASFTYLSNLSNTKHFDWRSVGY